MTPVPAHQRTLRSNRLGWWLLLAAFVLTLAVYWPGLSGGFLFDDYPNIVDNHGVQPSSASISSLVGAALSSPSSEFKRPLASLSFAVNYLISGIDPYWMKLTNLVIHLFNGLLVFLLARALLRSAPTDIGRTRRAGREGIVAALIAAGWMLLPINLTGVLYVVQRMESMANLFVLIGLVGYVAGRKRMLGAANATEAGAEATPNLFAFLLCAASITLPALIGILAKETAVMLPLYALLIEWVLFGFRRNLPNSLPVLAPDGGKPRRDRRIIGLFLLVLVIPLVIGVAWLLPGVLNAETWASRDFTLTTRLLSEARIIIDYIVWTLLPTPGALSFYHDDFQVSQGLLQPWTTLACIVSLAGLIALMFWLRRRQPLAALGVALFLGCQLLTGTILPLELIYEHRNYFASFGLMLAIVPLLAAPQATVAGTHHVRESLSTALVQGPSRTEPAPDLIRGCAPTERDIAGLPMALPRHVLLGGLLLCWATLTALTAYAWGNPLRLAEDLASRAPQSPRAEYELGRTYIVYSHYDPASPFTKLAYAPLEKAAALPDASILPEQALIFMNSRMRLPIRDAWWDSLITKLKARSPGVQDESSLSALTQCDREGRCNLSKRRMIEAYLAALSHPNPSARLLAMYGDYAWNVLEDHALGLSMTHDAVNTAPREPAYQITLIRMLAAQGRAHQAEQALQRLDQLNTGGRLNEELESLRKLLIERGTDSVNRAQQTQPTRS